MIASIWFSSVYQSVYSRQKNSDGSRDQWLIIWRDFKKNRLAIIGLICVLGFYAVALLAPLLAVADPNMQGDVVKTRYLSPSFDHPLGTDKFGRDIFSRLIYGSRISLSIGFVAVSISVVIGTAVGAISGYFGQMIDTVLMRFVDILLAFPRIFLVLALIAMYSNSLWLTMAVLGFTGWMGTSRIVRGQVLSIKEEGYILAAKALGMSHTRIIFRHILPNVLAPVIVVATLGIGNTILAESFLSYLGLSVQPPTPTWGNIIFQGQDNMLSAWWISTFPGIAIVFTALSYNLVGDGLRDALDPKLRNI
ncbi:MAG: peptide ABC transporter permease [Candidatus Cloacimonetes bacterium 4572_55]|nr:MAG: peptide ABC transporter permease [Candidatus Cloacimonetes bacterium 4572_55]